MNGWHVQRRFDAWAHSMSSRIAYVVWILTMCKCIAVVLPSFWERGQFVSLSTISKSNWWSDQWDGNSQGLPSPFHVIPLGLRNQFPLINTSCWFTCSSIIHCVGCFHLCYPADLANYHSMIIESLSIIDQKQILTALSTFDGLCLICYAFSQSDYHLKLCNICIIWTLESRSAYMRAQVVMPCKITAYGRVQ